MRLIRIGAAVLNQTPLAWDDNKAHIVDALEAGRAEGVAVLCFPELCISGYGCEDAFHSPGVLETAWEVLEEIAPATSGMVVSLGLPLQFNNVVFNAAALVVNGRVEGFVAKRFLASEGIHYEPRWFKPWPLGRQSVLRRGGRSYPIGDIYFDCGGIKVGFEICEDAWVADRPGGNMFLKGVDVIMNPSASHFAFGKDEIRQRFVLEGSRAFGVSYLYANLLGNEAGRAIYDGGAMVASLGKMLASGRRFSFQDWQLTSALVDLDLTRMSQARSAGASSQLDEDHSDCIQVPFAWSAAEPVESGGGKAAWERSGRLKEEEFTRAVALGLFDYLRKSRSRGFVVSLSGGADSSAVACLVSLMVQLAVRELGVEAFKARLGNWAELAEAPPARLAAILLTCAYQSTRNSSETTREAARTVAEAVGGRFFELDVDRIVQDYVEMVSDGIGRPLTWETDDVALQNIQARVRAPSVWLLANLQGALLLATSNRSEAAVGYATMDGDTCGGLSPIAGIDKAFLRQWLGWLESEGPQGLGPIPALAAVNSQDPTAELRPRSSEQTDEKDLMPYELLDAIERAAIRDKRTPLEVYKVMRLRFPQYERRQLGRWTERFFRLWCRNQWKRERYAPSFHVDDENLDPKTWCRFPILSGGFERELAQLRRHLEEEAPEQSGEKATAEAGSDAGGRS